AGGWKVIKVLWSSEWDSLLRRDFDGVLKKRMEEVCDGEYQKYVVSPGSYMRSHFFGKYPELTKLVEGMSDEELCNLKRGGHDQAKVYAAYSEAVQETDAPTVILAKTIKGFGLGEAGAASNTTHQQKQLDEKELRAFRDRFEIPVTDRQIADTPFYRPSKESPEIQYLLEKREQLGGLVPARTVRKSKDLTCSHSHFEDFYSGSDGNPVSTTSAFVHLLGKLLQDNDVGNRIVPIIPDEARTFGLDALFSKVGIYSPEGQLYEPVDSEHLLYYREEKDGQILEEGITEAGAMASFIAAGTSYATHAEPVIPFYLFYSMFGFQRVGDLIWAALDSRVKGFLLGATAGRTTLNGEGLQHQDGHSHAIASTFPGIKAYDPAFAYETSTIVEAGLKEICASGDENILYYLTLYNEQYPMPERPDGVREGIIKGMYLLSECQEMTCKGHILASGPIIQEALRAQQRLAEDFQVGASVWSVTSFSELRKDALAKERYNLFHPGDDPKKSYLERSLEGTSGVFIAATDYVRLVPDQIARWIPGSLYSLGTDGFGRSDTRKALRRFFEIDAESIVLAFLSELRATEGMDSDTLQEAFYKLEMDPAKRYPEAI
ncbi:MAG: pyruvate dehydrogenase (acetyl-transferring), homodimeric type, partial [Bdellovibrionales bacterium]|nr:pyruvate dehydrogenase (acetyl-transferring), homodimeric type [Bdellovibrionales bacterium]